MDILIEPSPVLPSSHWVVAMNKGGEVNKAFLPRRFSPPKINLKRRQMGA